MESTRRHRPALLRLSLFLVAIAMGTPSLPANPLKKSPEKLDQRIRRSADRFIEMQAQPEKRIPADLIAKARGIVILHKVKAGLLIGGEAGNGVAMVRDGRTGQWSAPAFVSSGEGSYGLQIGAQETTVVLLLMNEVGLKPLLGGSVDVGVDLAATAGPYEKGGKIDTTTIKDPILVYTSADGLFAGAALKGGGLLPAEKNNELYYGRGMNEVLFDPNVRPTPTGQHLVNVVETYAGKRGY